MRFAATASAILLGLAPSLALAAETGICAVKVQNNAKTPVTALYASAKDTSASSGTWGQNLLQTGQNIPPGQGITVSLPSSVTGISGDGGSYGQSATAMNFKADLGNGNDVVRTSQHVCPQGTLSID